MKSVPSRALIASALSFMIALASACGGTTSAAHGPGMGGSGPGEVGRLAPALSIQSLNGKGTVSLTSLSGKVAIVDFWATWCEPCKKSLPKLEELAKQSGGKVEVVGISVDDTRDGVAAFAKAQGASFPVAWDENKTLARRWSVQKMPTTYILDATGTVRFMHEAYRDEGDLIAKEIAQLTNEPSKTKTEGAVVAPVAAAVVVAAAPPVTAAASAPPAQEPTPEPSTDAAPTTKPKAKPRKTGPKKKTAAPAGKSRGV